MQWGRGAAACNRSRPITILWGPPVLGELLGMESLICRILGCTGAPPDHTKPADRERCQGKRPRERRPKYTTASHIKSPLCSVSFYPKAKKLWAQKGEGCQSKETTPFPLTLKVQISLCWAVEVGEMMGSDLNMRQTFKLRIVSNLKNWNESVLRTETEKLG